MNDSEKHEPRTQFVREDNFDKLEFGEGRDSERYKMAYLAARERVSDLHLALDYSVVSIQLVSSEDESDIEAHVVVHNPFDVRQFYTLCILPSLDMQLHEMMHVQPSVHEAMEKLSEDDGPGEMAEDLRLKRIMFATVHDAEFASKMFPNGTVEGSPSREEAFRLYLEHYNLTEGGDFNAPLRR